MRLRAAAGRRYCESDDTTCSSDAVYGSALRRVLEIQGSGAVEYCETVHSGDPAGVLVLDAEHLRRIVRPIPHPERIVLVAGNAPEDMDVAWNAGLQSVVLRDDPISTAALAVMAAGLGVPEMRNGDFSRQA